MLRNFALKQEKTARSYNQNVVILMYLGKYLGLQSSKKAEQDTSWYLYFKIVSIPKILSIINFFYFIILTGFVRKLLEITWFLKIYQNSTELLEPSVLYLVQHSTPSRMRKIFLREVDPVRFVWIELHASKYTVYTLVPWVYLPT